MDLLTCSYLGKETGEELGTCTGGSVIGVFHNGWYLGTQSSVWMLHDPKDGQVPFGIGIDEFIQNIPYDKSLEGCHFCVEGDFLRIPEADLTIRRSSAGYFDTFRFATRHELQGVRALMESCLLEEGRGELCLLLAPQGSSITGFLGVARERVAAFLAAVYALDIEAATNVLRKMIGLGKGLTPAIDDWLVGFLYVALRARGSLVEKQFFQRLACAVQTSVIGRTNRISGTYLSAVAKGLCFEALDKALFAKKTEDMTMLLSVGSSSGSDMLTGMVYAISCIEKLNVLGNEEV